MPRLTAAVLAVLMLALAAGCGGGGFPDGLTGLRICAPGSFDEDARECERDERAAALVAPTFYCTARVGGREGKRAALRWFASGDLLVEKDVVLDGGSIVVWSNVRLGASYGERPLVGGPWRCEVQLGSERAAARFRSGGPVPVVADAWACRASATRLEGGTRMCIRDESKASIPAGRVTCSTGMAGAKGREGRVTLLRRGRLIDTRAALLPSTSTSLSISWQLPAGSYECRFAVVGGPGVARSFTIA